MTESRSPRAASRIPGRRDRRQAHRTAAVHPRRAAPPAALRGTSPHTTACLSAMRSVTSGGSALAGGELVAQETLHPHRRQLRQLHPAEARDEVDADGDLVLGLGPGGAVADHHGVADPLLEEHLDGHPSGAGDALFAFSEQAFKLAFDLPAGGAGDLGAAAVLIAGQPPDPPADGRVPGHGPLAVAATFRLRAHGRPLRSRTRPRGAG